MDNISQDLITRIELHYNETGSLKETAKAIQLSEAKTRKILISLGIIYSEIADYIQQGRTVNQAMSHFGVSSSTVNNWLPYTRGAYGKNPKKGNGKA